MGQVDQSAGRVDRELHDPDDHPNSLLADIHDRMPVILKAENYLGGSIGFRWQVSHGIHPGNKSRDHSGVLCGLRGTLSVTFEEGTGRVAVRFTEAACGQAGGVRSAKNALLKDGNKSDRINAHKLAELLYLNKLSSVYHGETGVRMLRELARSYLTIVKD